MIKEENIKLPFWETIGRSFKYVLKNRNLIMAILPVIVVLTIIQILLNFPFMCTLNQDFCSTGIKQNITIISLLLASAGIIINYCRTIIQKSKVDYVSKSFWKRLAIYLVASFAMSIFISLIALPASVAFIYLLGFMNLSLSFTFIVSVIFIIVSVIFAPLFLVFPAITVDDFKFIGFKKLFNLVKGNNNAIFWGQFVIMTPYWILSSMMYQLYGSLGISNYVVNLLFVIIGISLGILDACFKGAFFAHIYQFFKFYDKEEK